MFFVSKYLLKFVVFFTLGESQPFMFFGKSCLPFHTVLTSRSTLVK